MKKKQIIYSRMQAARLRKLDLADLHRPRSTDAAVLVSLTSIPSRFASLDLVVRSLLSQSVAPRRVVLWLNTRHQDTVPDTVLALCGGKFEIRWTEQDSCHCKLAPSLDAFGDETIVTCDDDLMLRRGWLSALLDSHSRYPNEVIAHIARALALGADGHVMPYDAWRKQKARGLMGHHLVQMGYGGVLYPPGSLHADATDAGLYMALTPRADDLWFKMMAYLAGTPVRTADRRVGRPREIVGADEVRLKPSNVNEDGNRAQWLALCQHYGVASDALLSG